MEVKVRIKDPLLRAYLNGLFEYREGAYVANMDTFTGVVICSLARTCDTPHKIDDETAVTFNLSKSHYNDEFRNRFLYMGPTSEAKVNIVLQKEFNCNFTAYCVQSKTLGLPIKDTIEQFIVENNMDEFFGGEIETLKKRFYRSQVSTMKNAQARMRKKAYYALHRAIKTKSVDVNI